MVDKLISLLAMTLKFMFKEKAKDKAELVLALASLVREIKEALCQILGRLINLSLSFYVKMHINI